MLGATYIQTFRYFKSQHYLSCKKLPGITPSPGWTLRFRS